MMVNFSVVVAVLRELLNRDTLASAPTGVQDRGATKTVPYHNVQVVSHGAYQRPAVGIPAS